MDFRFIFLCEKIRFKKEILLEGRGKTTMRLGSRKVKWVVTPACAGRRDKTWKETRPTAGN
jgi:hypothetical protein